MKKLTMVLVCLMTMVMSVNAQTNFVIGNNLYYDICDKVIYFRTGIATQGLTLYDLGYAIDKKHTNDFISFLNELKIIFKRYEKIADDNNVTNFEKTLKLKHPYMRGCKKILHATHRKMFEGCGTPTLIDGWFSIKFNIDILGDCKINFCLKYKEQSEVKNIYWTIESPEMIDEIVKELSNIDTKILTLDKILREKNEKRQQKREAELRERQRIEDLFK